MKKGRIIIISGPSQVGKDAIVKEIRKKKRKYNVAWTITYTTRPKRKVEREGIHHHFISKDEFEKKIKKGFFLEWARVRNYYFGTPKKDVLKFLKEGKNVLLKIDVQGQRKVHGQFPQDTVSIFIRPKNITEIKRRMKNNPEISDEQMAIRLKEAQKELSLANTYDYVLVNPEGKLHETIDRVFQVLEEINSQS